MLSFASKRRGYAVEAFGDVGIQHVLRLELDVVVDRCDRIVGRAARPKAVGVRLELGFPFRFQGQLTNACWAWSRMVGMPRGRCSPFGFGM